MVAKIQADVSTLTLAFATPSGVTLCHPNEYAILQITAYARSVGEMR